MNKTLYTYTTPWGVDVHAMGRDETSDMNTLISCIKEDEYCAQRLPDHGVAIDLGAHIGASMLEVLSRGWYVYGVEALPENAKLCLENIKLNDYSKSSKLYENAIAGKSGLEIPVYYSDLTSAFGKAHEFIGSTMKRGKENSQTSIKDGRQVMAKTITLEQIFEENKIKRCGFLKVDIEGSEWEVFETLPEEFLKRIDRIAIELDSAIPTSTQEFMRKYLKGYFLDVSQDYFPQWCNPGTLVHGYFINKNI